MSESIRPAAAENPFSSRRVRPGAVPYVFAAGASAGQLVEHLRGSGWWGQIVGPHGSGKSGLLATLLPVIERAGKQTLLVELHDGQRRLPVRLRRAAAAMASAVLVVDGYEQLAGLHRWRVKRFCRRRRMGLLVTAHGCVGLPDLFATTCDLALAERIVAGLQRDLPTHVRPQDVAEPFRRHAGNLREVLFDLYDLYEQRRAAAAG